MSSVYKPVFMIGFFHEDEEYGCFSNWYPAEFVYAGKRYANSEQFMMVQKVMMFGKYDLADQIMQTADPAKCKKIAGQKFPEFDASLWEKTCRTIVKRGVKAKFAQNEDILQVLLGTGNALLAECSPYDKKWGIGIDISDPDRFTVAKWQGKNLLGRILMEVRQELRQEILVSSSSGDSLKYIDAVDLKPIPEWNMTAGELKRFPQFYHAIHAYAYTIKGYHNREAFYHGSSLYSLEANKSIGKFKEYPEAGFYEMKQEVYDIARRSVALAMCHPLKRLLYDVPQAWDDLDYFKKLLLDYYPSDKLRRNLLFISAEEGIPQQLISLKHFTSQDQDKLIQFMVDASGCQEKYAIEIISEWADALGIIFEGNQDKQSFISGNDTDNDIVEMGIVSESVDFFDSFGIDDFEEDLPFEDSGTMGDLEIDDSLLVQEETDIDDRTNLPKFVLDMNIDELELSVRTYNCLKRAGINTVRELAYPDNNYMGKVRNLGRKSLEELLSKLKEWGYDPKRNTGKYDEHNHPGRDKCDALRGIRKKIAEANGIAFDFPECHHTGPCKGTCPACEAEVRYLDEELQKKKERGEEISLVGLAADDIKQSGCHVIPDTDSCSELIDEEEEPAGMGMVDENPDIFDMSILDDLEPFI